MKRQLIIEISFELATPKQCQETLPRLNHEPHVSFSTYLALLGSRRLRRDSNSSPRAPAHGGRGPSACSTSRAGCCPRCPTPTGAAHGLRGGVGRGRGPLPPPSGPPETSP